MAAAWTSCRRSARLRWSKRSARRQEETMETPAFLGMGDLPAVDRLPEPSHLPHYPEPLRQPPPPVRTSQVLQDELCRRCHPWYYILMECQDPYQDRLILSSPDDASKIAAFGARSFCGRLGQGMNWSFWVVPAPARSPPISIFKT